MNFTTQSFYHPATLGLLRQRFHARLARIGNAFSNPRRKVLAFVSLALGFVWLSQAVASVMLRDAADPQKLRLWIPLGLLVYSLWHIIKITLRKPVEPFEWTPAEQELVCAAPVTRTQLISYRMASIVSSAAIKAVCFSIVMIPDLEIWVFGLIGMFFGLVFVDLLRIGVELAFHGFSKRGQQTVRCFVIVGLIGVLGWALTDCLFSANSKSEIASPGALLFFQSFVGKIIGLSSTSVGIVLLAAFQPFSNLVLADGFSIDLLAAFGLSVAIVIGAGCSVYCLDDWTKRRRRKLEKLAFLQAEERRSFGQPVRGQGNNRTDSIQADRSIGAQHKNADSVGHVRVPWRMGGFGSLAWRQLMGAYHYRMTVLVSLGIPTGLCCIPLFADHNPLMMLMNVVAGLVFYSFLLLPSALILDFRRDVDRFAVLKSLPIHPFVVTIGQLAAPVLICSTFQWLVLTIAVLSGSVVAWQAIVAAVLLLPINTLIFAIENFAFMLSPYRRNREGIDVFLRTILTFTGKGLLFAAGLALTLVWAFASRSLCLWMDWPSAAGAIFGVGAWSMACLMAAAFVLGTVRLYDKLDASEVVV